MIAIVAPKAPPKHITTRNEDDEDDEDLVSPLRFRAIFFSSSPEYTVSGRSSPNPSKEVSEFTIHDTELLFTLRLTLQA
jgi:hypothetical protein